MATSPRPEAGPRSRQSVKDRIEKKLREGYRPRGQSGSGPGAVLAASYEAVAEGEFSTDKAFAAAAYGLVGEWEPDWSLYRPARPQQPSPTVMLREAPPAEPSLATPPGEPETVLVIPDRHNDPRHPHRLACSTWIARLGSERRPKKVICLGDAIAMDSCSRHDRNETLKGRLKPSITADLDNHEQSLMAFERGRDPHWKPIKIKCQGNHEARLWEFENQHPESEGSHTHRYAQDLLRFGWRERPYGEFAYVGGVAFTHAPINGMGRPMGGKTATHRAGGMLTSSLVHGHTHQLHVFTDAKMGERESLTVIQAGCALPWGEYEHYARVGPGGWWWGVLMLTIWGGQITDLETLSMLTLRDRYSDDGGDVRAA